MAMQVKKGTITAKTGSTGSVSYTGVGFQPKAVLFWGTNQTAAGVLAQPGFFFGAAAGSGAQWVASIASDDNVAVTNAGRRLNTAACIEVLANGTPTDDAVAALTSFDADGFTLNWSDFAGSAWLIHYLAIGGSDVTNAATGIISVPATTGNQAITGVGFQPDFVLLGSVAANATGGLQTQGNLALGVASASSERAAVAFRDRDAVASGSARDGASAQVTTAVLRAISSTAGSDAVVADLTSFDAGGFTLNWTTAATLANGVAFLALKGGRYEVRADTQRTSTGTKATTGVGFTPRGLLAFSWNKAAATTIDTAGSPQLTVGGHGTQGSAASGYALIRARDGQTTNSDIDGRTSTSALLGTIADAAQTVSAEAAVSTLDADGVTLNWTTADATARQFALVAFGDTNSDQTVAPNAVSSPARVWRPYIARAGDPASGSAIFTDTFDDLADGDLDVVAASTWNHPLWTGQNAIRVVSGQAQRAAAASWSDVYSDVNTYGDGDYLYVVDAGPASTHVLFLHAFLAPNGAGGVDGYSIRLDVDSFRLVRIDNDAFTNLSGDVAWTGATGDEFVIRRQGTAISVWARPAGGTWTEAIAPITDGTYLTGSIGLETDSPAVRVGGIGIFNLPSVDQTVTPNAVASPSSVGAPTVTPGAVTVAPNAVASPATVGQPQVTQEVQPAAVASPASVGAPTVTPGPVTVAPNAVASPAAVGSPTITVGAVTVTPGRPALTETFPYSDGVLQTVSGGAWGPSIWGTPMDVASGDATTASVTGWEDTYSAASYGPDLSVTMTLAASWAPGAGWNAELTANMAGLTDTTVDEVIVEFAWSGTWKLWSVTDADYASPLVQTADGPVVAAGGKVRLVHVGTALEAHYLAPGASTWQIVLSATTALNGVAGRVGWGTNRNGFAVSSIEVVEALGVASPASVGQPDVQLGAVVLTPNAVASPATVGQPTVTPGPVTIDASPPATVDTFGTDATPPTGWGADPFGGLPNVRAISGQLANVAQYGSGYRNTLLGRDQEVIVTWATLDATAGNRDIALFARATNPGASSSGYVLDVDTDNTTGVTTWSISKRVAGVQTVISSLVPQALTAGGQVRFTLAGAVLTGWWRATPGAAWTQVVTVTDTTLMTGGYQGIYINGTGNRFDDWTARELVAATSATVGAPTVVPGSVTVAPSAVTSPASVGQPTVTVGAVTVVPQAVPSAATVGQPGLVYDQVVAPSAVASPSSVGQPTVVPGPVTVAPASVASPATVGQPAVTPGAVTVAPNPVASPATVSSPTVTYDQTIAPSAVASPASVGQPQVTAVAVTIVPETVASPATIGLPSVSRTRNPAIYARGPRELAADVRLKGADGYWMEVGKGVARGITVEGLQITSNRKGPDTCSFTLRRDPTRPWPEFAAFNRGEVVIGGERLWAGRLKEAPGQTGAETTISFSGEGRQYEQDDDLVQIGFVHQRLDDWVDARHVPGAIGSWTQGSTVENDQGRIILGYPVHTDYFGSNGTGVRLDLGELHSRAEEVVVECVATNPNGFASVYVRGHNTPDALNSGTQGVDWDDYVANFSFASVSSSESSPTILRGSLSPGYRYVTVIFWTAPGSGNTGSDHLLKINRIAVSSSMAFLEDTAGKSVLRASDVVSYLVQSGRIGPNLSRSTDEIETTGLIDGSTYGIPDLWLGPSSPRELVDAVNAYHDYLAGVDPDGRVFFKAPPATPDLEVGAWAGAEFNDASASSAADVYTKVIGEATGPDGQPFVVTRHAVQASPELVDRSDVSILSNPSFASSTTGWGATVGSIARVTTDTYDGGGAGQVSTAAGGRTATVEANLLGLTAGRTYAIRVPAKKGTTTPEPSYDWWARVLSNTGVVLDSVSDPVQGNTYRDHYLTFTADATSATLEIGATIAEAAPGASVAFYIDGLKTWLVEVNAADRAGNPRATRIPIGATMTRASLETLLDVWLRNHLTTPLKGSLQVTGQGGVRRFRGGTGVPAHELLLYPGRLIWLSNVEDPDSGAWGRSGTIASVTYSHDDRSATVEIDNERRRFDTFVSRIAALVDQVR